MSPSTPEHQPETDPAELITRELERIEVESYGTGVHGIRTVIDDSFVLAIVENELSTAERTLLEAGRGETVKATRMAYQAAIQPTFVAMVERALGRRVTAFVSHFNVDPVFSLEFFMLAPVLTELGEPRAEDEDAGAVG